VSRDAIGELEPPLLDLHAADWTAPGEFEIRPDARRFETWEGNVAGKIGLGVAVDYALALGITAIEARVTALADRLRERLAELPGATVHDRGERRCGIVTFTLGGVPSLRVRDELRAVGINTSITGAASARFDLPERGLDELVRASVHYYNTADEQDRLCERLQELTPS
jgi:selenocysteine lyase/cysteine desulfurase